MRWPLDAPLEWSAQPNKDKTSQILVRGMRFGRSVRLDVGVLAQEGVARIDWSELERYVERLLDVKLPGPGQTHKYDVCRRGRRALANLKRRQHWYDTELKRMTVVQQGSFKRPGSLSGRKT